jgi:hypothetical protein
MLTIPLAEATDEQLHKALTDAKTVARSFEDRRDVMHTWGATIDAYQRELARRSRRRA